MRGGEKPWGRGKRTFCLGRVICFAEKGDKEVIADWRIQGWTPLPQRRRRHVDTYYKRRCWNVSGVGSL